MMEINQLAVQAEISLVPLNNEEMKIIAETCEIFSKLVYRDVLKPLIKEVIVPVAKKYLN
jgi:hypothetical protein